MINDEYAPALFTVVEVIDENTLLVRYYDCTFKVYLKYEGDKLIVASANRFSQRNYTMLLSAVKSALYKAKNK